MSLRSIALSALIALLVWYWLKARELKERVFNLASARCEELGLSLLDQAVVLKKLSIARDRKGRFRLLREYQFDFSSTGEDRYKGMIRLIGTQVDELKLAPHRVD